MEQCGNARAPKSGVYGVVVVVVVVIVVVVSSRCREWYLECSRRNTVTAGRIFFTALVSESKAARTMQWRNGLVV